jgi:superfamily II DNA/RNA helicase
VHPAQDFLAAIDFAHRQSRHLVLTAARRHAVAAMRHTRCLRGTENMTTQRNFADLGVPTRLINALTAQGIVTPFPIQVDTLPDTLAGRDVLGRGKTGSGKTLAFSIPLVARLASGKRRPSRPSGLVLAPTRELATQISAVLVPLAAAHDLKVGTIFGGVPQNRQVAALRSGLDIVVACPGRLEDLMRQRLISLDSVEITVLDEADHMADLGFLPGVIRILAATPAGGQRMLFSATLDNGVDKLVKRFLRNEMTHSVDEVNSPVAEMTHHVFHVAGVDAKRELIHKLASGSGRRILFMRTKHQARKLARQLTEAGVPSVDLHGNLSQPARDRNLAAFSAGKARVLVATDIAARGVHVDEVELVVHVDPPAEHKAYLHRSGRTARAGSAGDVVTVVLPEQRKDLTALMRKAGINVRPQQVTAHCEPVTKLVGDVAPYRAPAPKAAPPARTAPARSRRRRPAPGAQRRRKPVTS